MFDRVILNTDSFSFYFITYYVATSLVLVYIMQCYKSAERRCACFNKKVVQERKVRESREVGLSLYCASPAGFVSDAFKEFFEKKAGNFYTSDQGLLCLVVHKLIDAFMVR